VLPQECWESSSGVSSLWRVFRLQSRRPKTRAGGVSYGSSTQKPLVASMSEAESYLSDHFGINLFWRERRQLPVNSCMIVATMRFEPLKAALFKAKNSYTKRLIVHEIIPPLATKFVTSSKLCAFRELLTWFFKHDQKLKKLRITATRTWESQSHLTFVIHSVTAADSSDARISIAFKTENSEQNKRMR